MIRNLSLAISLIMALSQPLIAAAPVVDSSENYAMLNPGETPSDEQPLAEAPIDTNEAESQAVVTPSEPENTEVETAPLAQDNSDDRDNVSLLNKLQTLQQEVQELRGQLEVQAHDLKLLQQQQLTFYKDLDARLHNLTSNANDQPNNQKINTSPVIGQEHGNPADEQISYLAAYELVKSKQVDEGIPAMQTFLQKYPKGGYAANAQYWLGELFLLKKNYPQAIHHFETVLQEFPSSSKSAAAMLKLGYALADSGRKNEALQQLEQVIKKYPDTNSAQLAKEKLTLLRS